MIEADAVEPVVRALLGAIDVDGGATPEQRAVLDAIVHGAWGRSDLDLAVIEPLGPGDAAGAVAPSARRRTRELLVLLELCRHPLTDAQVARVDEYAEALGEDDDAGITSARDLVRDGAAAAMADYMRYVDETAPHLAEPSLRDYPTRLDEPDHELAARLRALHDLPAGTLGHEYVDFYRRNGLTLPGDDPYMPAVFVAHDMSHVVGGYEPTGQGEIALGAMQLAAQDTDDHWIQFLGNLAVHEAGYLSNETVSGKQATMTRAGAPELVANAMRRGAQCTDDFTIADHLALVATPIDDVRARFGVPALDPDAGTNAVPR